MPKPPLLLAGEHHGRDHKPYRPSDALRAAANAALHLQTPLLLAGEPGCGKTDFAWYAARALAQAIGETDSEKALPLECYIHSDTGAADLLYHYDAMARFANAQPGSDEQKRSDPRHYITLEPLGVALMSTKRRVLLIDEIDKAPRDLSNDLLREMDQGHFVIPEIPRHLTDAFPDPNERSILLQREMKRQPLPKPLVIVTSNAERQLPEAFLRRCVYFYITFPQHAALIKILEDRLLYPEPPNDYTPAVATDLQQRQRLIQAGASLAEGIRDSSARLSKRPGTAEIIGWLRTLIDLGSQEDQRKLLTLDEAYQRKVKVSWKDLPGLHCLVKLKEDLKTLGYLTPEVAP